MPTGTATRTRRSTPTGRTRTARTRAPGNNAATNGNVVTIEDVLAMGTPSLAQVGGIVTLAVTSGMTKPQINAWLGQYGLSLARGFTP